VVLIAGGGRWVGVLQEGGHPRERVSGHRGFLLHVSREYQGVPLAWLPPWLPWLGREVLAVEDPCVGWMATLTFPPPDSIAGTKQGGRAVRHARLRLFGVLAGVALLAASCNWPLDRYGPDRTGYTPFNDAISPANVSQLSQQWTATLGGPGSDPVVADGHVFTTFRNVNAGTLDAFDSSGAANCTGSAPKSCSPQWSASVPGVPTAGAVHSGAVWVGAGGAPGSGSLDAYNESTGAPIVSGGVGALNGPAVTGNTVYANWIDTTYQLNPPLPPNPPLGGLEAVDATTGTPTIDFGDAGSPYDLFSGVAVANGTLYAVNGTTLEAFDATGKTNCGPTTSSYGFSTMCTPLWSAKLSGYVNNANNNTFVAVANGYVYIGDSSAAFATGSSGGTLYAFPAGGCGAATCSPAWTAKTNGAIETSVAVTPRTVFVGSDDGVLSAFPATGCGAATCQPLWQAQTGGAVKSSPSVAGDVVYVGSDDDNLYAFNASGCGAATCTPLWQTNVGAPVETSPAIGAEGHVYVTDTAGTLHAYGLPAASSS
jgi:hypothetical protein